MNTKRLLQQAMRLFLGLGVAAMAAGAGSVWAQTAAPAGGTASGNTRLSEITVTGSHIPQTSIAKAQPVLNITREQIQATGFQTISQLLMNLSSAGPSLSRQINNGNVRSGYETVNLHDLGNQRVLVLVNGQRWISTLGGFVDLNTIPLSMVSRIEILLDGASAIYGSEAIAGVINIITVKNYNGAEAHAYYGGYDAKGAGGGWDGKTQQYSFTVGTSEKNSAVLLSAGYYQQDPVWKDNRWISKEPRIGYGVVGGGITPGGRFRVLLGPYGNTPSGCAGAGTLCDISGPDVNDPTGFHAYTLNDRENPEVFNYLMQPSERWYIYSQGHYDLTNNVSFHFTTTYQHRDSNQVIVPTAFSLGETGHDTQNGLNIGVAANAPGNPFGVDLVPYSAASSQFLPWCQRYGSPTCATQYDVLLSLGRTATELGPRVFAEKVNTFYMDGGFNGYFQVASNQWQWNLDYIYSQSLQTNITYGFANTTRLQNALSYGCATTAGCVPINIFDGAVANGGAGSISPAAASYVGLTAHGARQEALHDYNGTVSGNFWDSWYAGPWGVAFGYEYEAVDGFNQPDALISSGNTTSQVIQSTGGRENTNAQFVELNVPLAHNAFLAKELDIDVAQRYSQFHWVGIGNVFNPQTASVGTAPAAKYAHSATPRVTFKWKPIDDLLLRGSWSQAFRIPSLSELFFGASDNSPAVMDPCAANPATTPRASLPPGCNGNYHFQPGRQIRTLVGGNSQLNPEKATTRTAGLVFSPHWVQGLDFSADYFKTEVTDLIQSAGPQFWVDNCYFDQNPQSCAHILTKGTGDNTTIAHIIDLNANGGSQTVEGWDLGVNYRFPITPVGQFAAHLTMTFLQKDIICEINGLCQDIAGTVGPTVTGATGSHSAQRGAQAKHRYNLGVHWAYGPWTATWNVVVIGPVWENCALSRVNGEGLTPGGPPVFGWCSKIIALNPSGTKIATGVNHLGTTVYNDLQASYTVASWNTTFTVGVNNIFNKEPPIGMTTFTNNFFPSPYRLPGRFIYARVSAQF